MVDEYGVPFPYGKTWKHFHSDESGEDLDEKQWRLPVSRREIYGAIHWRGGANTEEQVYQTTDRYF